MDGPVPLIVPGLRDHVAQHWQTLLAERLPGARSLVPMGRDNLALGIEYRDKPDNLSVFREQAASDVFVAWFPNKHVAVVGAWADLGGIATLDDQRGAYLSVQLSF